MIYLLLGTNLGDKNANLEKAASLLREKLHTDLSASIVMETKAIGFEAPDFLNQIIFFENRGELTPLELLKICQSVECEMGREKHTAQFNADGTRKYESRIIDIDILLFDNQTIDTEYLTIPHPQVIERPFVKELLNTLN